MNKFTVAVCDDRPASLAVIKAKILALKSKFDFLDAPISVSFDDILQRNVLSNYSIDVLILDLYDEQSTTWLGNECLELLAVNDSKIPVIIYSGDKQGAERDQDFKTKYKFVIADLYKQKDKINGVAKVLESLLLEKMPAQYSLLYEDDLITKYQIQTIGEPGLNQIIQQVKQKFRIDQKIEVSTMISGLSGAFLFKFTHKNTNYILKVSNDVKKLSEEYENSKELYHKFPTNFFNYISHDYIITENQGTAAIIIKLLDDGKTLFETLVKVMSFDEVKSIFEKLFTDEHSLKRHYLINRGEKQSWTAIFEKFSALKFSLVDEIIKELNPLLKKESFDYSAFKNFIVYGSFKNLDKNHLFIQKESVLCHGDLHSKNILIQGMHPFLIDTGGMSYNYWCTDICRLIVNLFLRGFDYQTKEYFDIDCIENNLEIAKIILQQKEISLDGKNDNIIHSINWLNENCEKIFGNLYSKLEFQMGLIKEFLQFSYWIAEPPNKRTIALLSSYEGLIIANNTSIELQV